MAKVCSDLNQCFVLPCACSKDDIDFYSLAHYVLNYRYILGVLGFKSIL